VTAIVAEDARTVRIDLAAPNPALLSLLSVSPYSVLPMRELEEGSFDPSKALLGSGPFKVTAHLQGQSWTLARNPHYGREGRPALERFVIRVLTNEAPASPRCGPGRSTSPRSTAPHAGLVRGIPGVKFIKQTTPNYWRLDVNAVQDSSVMKDPRVRQAMHYALDREAIARIVFGGEAEAGDADPGGDLGRRLRGQPVRRPAPAGAAGARTGAAEGGRQGGSRDRHHRRGRARFLTR
jgi:peptide/nickel transport system substrate-binding protein